MTDGISRWPPAEDQSIPGMPLSEEDTRLGTRCPGPDRLRLRREQLDAGERLLPGHHHPAGGGEAHTARQVT